MLNVYNQDEQERDSIVQLPEKYADDAGNTLKMWLSSFWRKIHDGEDLVRGLQEIRGQRLAQMYLDMLEVLKLQDRNGAPVFHRELWYPIVIRKSKRNNSQENLLRVGVNGIVAGVQPPDSEYGEVMLEIGGLGEFSKYVTYPVDGGERIKSIATSITDNVLNPSVAMVSGVDFVFRGGCVIFPKESDPMRDGSPFDVYDVPGDKSDDPEDMDQEVVLWAADAIIDKDYISTHVSYAMGVSAPSTDIAKRIVNAAWDAVTGGPTPENVKKLMAAMLNIPVVQNDEETVVEISRDSDGVQKVVTDKMTYSVYPSARLRKAVSSGATLRKGELLDESLRVYPMMVDPDKAESLAGFGVPLREDIPSVVMDAGMLRAKTEHGVYAVWESSQVKRDHSRPTDSNGNPRLYFDIGGSKGDVEAFWSSVWSRAESQKVSMESIVGPEGSEISPAEFFLRNLVGANTLFVVVDREQLEDVSMMRDPMFFDMLCGVIPSAMRMFLVEHRSVSGEDEADLGEAVESTFVAAQIKGAEDFAGQAEDSVLMRLVRPAPAHVNRRKEEE